MKVTYTKQFIKDVKKYPELKKKISQIINTFQRVDSISGLRNIKKIKSTTNLFRIKIGNFRIGFSYINGEVTFKRFLHRKDIYKYFP